MDDGITPPKRQSRWVGWAWLVWWEIDPDELTRQVSEYGTLKLWQSMRGISVLMLGFAMLTTTVFIFVGAGGVDATAFVDVALMAVLALFIWLGHRWAMIAAMVLWTLEKLAYVVDGVTSGNGGGIVTQPIWWALYLHAFYFAFKVEQARRKLPPATDVSVFS